jgi:cytochrome c553
MRRSVCCLVLLAFAPGDWFGSAARGAAGERPLEPLDLEAEWKVQFQVLCQDLAQREAFARLAPQTHRAESLIAKSDRDPADVVLRRTAALLADLKRTSAAARLAGLEKQLDELAAAGGKIDPAHGEARFVLFRAACKVRREIALANPLLDFEQLLFIKRHRSSYSHMCDQYYGMTARPGGGLFVLSGPLGPGPRLRDVLADSVVENGRLQGRKLCGGSFLSPELSYDGKTIYFAYVECSGPGGQMIHTDPTRGHWPAGWCYHIFAVGVDGAGLRQLTDGTWNDFDPCPLPNGRIAFISERRGGYLRCGRECPIYTLYDMAADGSDINCLSVHETNEWNPSVTHDGRIIYTRWDYVDRHGCTAHMPWLTTLDGRDSRALHGNFTPRNLRPDMELDCRAVPGSRKYTATAAAHHGQAFGSLVLLDPQVPDDDAGAPVRRVTPEVGFPESQGGAQAYGTARPLSEDYFLCVYDATAKLGTGGEGGQYLPGNYGLYLLDSFGNKELIYRDPQIACQSPMPLRPTPPPPLALQPAKPMPRYDPSARPAAQQRQTEATLSLINVYDALLPWPAGTKIEALRVLQVLPMSVPSGGPPHETGLREASAGDSVVPVRYVLGTIPVEADGSAHFVVPANKEMFFQALDGRGLAVQSMRSATYLKEGEHLTCQGCHEPKGRAPQPPRAVPLALRRPPSKLASDVDGSNPFSYPRLVQPVLDRLCVDCHAKNPNKAASLAREPIQRNFFASYLALAPQYGFHDYHNSYRTTPGRFGARASKLFEILEKGHHDVKLSPDDFHRLTLWLDCSSLFYGVYEKEGGAAQLRGELARPTLE